MAAPSARCVSASLLRSRIALSSAAKRLPGARDLTAGRLRAHTFSSDRGYRSRDEEGWVENAAFGSTEDTRTARSASSRDHGAPARPAQDGDWNPFPEQAKDWSASEEYVPTHQGGMDRKLDAGQAQEGVTLPRLQPERRWDMSANADFSMRNRSGVANRSNSAPPEGSIKSPNAEFSLGNRSGRASWWSSEIQEDSGKSPNAGFPTGNRDSGASWYSREMQEGSNKSTNADSSMSWLNNEMQERSNKFANAGSSEGNRSGGGYWQSSKNVDLSIGNRNRGGGWYSKEMQEGSDKSPNAEFPMGSRSGVESSSSSETQKDSGFQNLYGLSTDNSGGDEAYSFKRIRQGSGITDINDPFASDDNNPSLVDTLNFVSESLGTSGRGTGDRAKDMASILSTNPGDNTLWGFPGRGEHLKVSDSFSMQDLSPGKSSLFSSESQKPEEIETFSYEELGEMLCELRPPLGHEPDDEMGFSFWELNERLEKMHEMLEAKSPEQEAFRELKKGVKELRAPKSPRLGSLQLSADDLSTLNNTGVVGNISESLEYVRPNFELLKKYYSLEQMSSKELLKIAIAKVKKEFQMHESDTGSPQVQVAILTMKIENLNRHFQENHNKKRDKHSRRGLNGMIEYRKRLLWYLRRRDWDAYCNVLTKLRLPDIIHERRL